MFDRFQTGPSVFAAFGVSPDQIRWSGEPQGGVKFRKGDVFAIPFSLMWGGFAIFWETMAFRGGAPLFFRLWGIPFVFVGLYIIAGRFFWDAYTRSRTAYALTGDSALILRSGLGGGMSTVYLPTVGSINLELANDGSGTIYFGNAPAFQQQIFGQTRSVVPSFAMIPDAASVYARCQAAQKFRAAS
jgi:hypothetical protein